MKKTLLTASLSFAALMVFGQQPVKWASKPENMPGHIKAFQENKGQFVNTVNDWTVLYGCDYEGTRTLFTNHGIIYIIPEVVKNPFTKTDNSEREEQEKENATIELHSVAVEWENASSTMTVEPIEVTPFYFGSVDPVYSGKSIDNIKGFRKLVFHNVQPGIDLEYTFHPKTGLKYSVIVHPGYDASTFRMMYTGQSGLSLNASGDLHIATPMGDIVDHAPVSFQNNNKIESSFKQSQNEVAFDVKNVRAKTDLVIDPWTVSITSRPFLPSDVVIDSLNNTYILGMDTNALFVQKYTSVGALSWTYALTQFGLPGYVSALAVDPLGNTYIPMAYPGTNSAGGYYGLLSLTSSGTLRYYNNSNPVTTPNMFEVWCLSYSHKYAELVEAGAPNIEQEEIAPVAATTGNLGTEVINTTYGEIFTGCIAPNGNYYGLTANPCFGCNSPGDNVVCYTISGATMAFAWNQPTNYQWNDFDNKNPNGIAANGIAAGLGYLYTSDGKKLDQRSLANGASLKNVVIPSGADSVAKAPSGIAVDNACGNVYVGTHDSVLVYDPNLNLLSIVIAPGAVYGVTCNNGLVSACGGSAGSGFLMQFATITSTCDTLLTVNTVAYIKPEFEVFPNPSNGLFNIRTTYDNNTVVEVYNSLGQFITQKKIMNGQATLDLSGEAAGIYCLRVINDSKSDHFNIVVSH